MFIRSLAVIAVIVAMLPLSLPSQVAAKKSWPTCENFLNQADAQAAYDADTSDPFGLVKAKQGNGVPCDSIATFGTQPLVSCDALADFPDAQAALQGLLDLTAAGGDPYALDPDGNGAACDQASGKGGDAETLDAPQSATPEDATPTDTTSQPDTGKARKVKNGGNASTSADTSNSSAPPPSNTSSSNSTRSTETGNDVTVIASTGGDESLGARLEARFAELEAQFATFSGDDDTTANGGQSSPVVVTTSPPATTTLGTTSPSTTSTTSTGTGTTTALHRGHHHKGHGKHHKGHKNGKHQHKHHQHH